MTALDRPLAAALSALADGDVAALLDDVRADGLRIARNRLSEAYADALVDAVARHRRTPPPASEPDQGSAVGCYVYAIVAGDGAGATTGEVGIEPGGAVEVVTAAGLSAVVSVVDVEAMRAGASDADIGEDGWLARAVRAQERVVLAAFHSAPTVPMRFGVVHPDHAAVEQLLRAHSDDLRAELRRVEDAAEWMVKLYADRATVAACASSDGNDDGDDEPRAAVSGGRDYLLRERARRDEDQRVDELVAEHARRLRQLLAEHTDDVVSTGSTSSDTAPAVFAAACLVQRGREQQLMAAIDKQAESWRALGLDVELTGPWPAYHFTTLRLGDSDV